MYFSFLCLFTMEMKSQTSLYYNAENLRSDTFDVLKYTINLEIGNSTNKLLKGNTQIRFAPKLNNRTFIRFDLLKMTIDSVKEGNVLLTNFYNDTIIRINFTASKNTTDTSLITIYYHGQPQKDATGWGGFYFDNTQGAEYAYNLGVGFDAKPHNYGRVWFPCFDNFVERSKYEFNITNDSTRRSYCNGALISDIVTGNKRTRKWVLNEQIPSYLACVALAGNYTRVNWNVNTLTGNKPIWLSANAADTVSMKNGFVNLINCIQGFENYYGPYRWNRIGYSIVPFNSGAMEHATNITYPKPFIGNLNYEADLMAHELAHHWWGDLITCQTPEDMWINEGMATFSAYMFVEWKYGRTAYLNKVKTQHDVLLRTLHKKEGGFRAVSGLPHTFTYSDHVYLKGADVAHTLRGYMGDTAFFNACKYTMQQNAFKHLNTLDLRNHFQTSSGQNLTNYFSNWVLGPGWPHFSIDSVRYVSGPPTFYTAIIYTKQKLFGATNYCSNVPMEVSFFKSDRSRVVRKILVNGAVSSATVSVPFLPVYAALNYDAKINDATSHETKILKTLAVNNFTLGKVIFNVQNTGNDSSLLRVVHHYVRPDAFKSNPFNHLLSDQHYWNIEGLLATGFVSKARFSFDGFRNLNSTNGFMDTLLTKTNADSIQLFYRKNTADDWRLQKGVTKVVTSTRAGYLEVDTVRIGEYCFGNAADTSGLGYKKVSKLKNEVFIYPNPAKNILFIEFKQKPPLNAHISIIDMSGSILLQKQLINYKNELDVSTLSKGSFIAEVADDKGMIFCQKILLE